MSLVADSEQAAAVLERLHTKLREHGDRSQDDRLSSITCMLQSPLFHQLLHLQQSLAELKQVSASHPLSENSFQFTPSGQLVLHSHPEGYVGPELSESATLSLRQPYTGPGSTISTHSYNIEFQRAIQRVAQGRETETIKLFKPDFTSLGFSVVGLKQDEDGELGIFVQDIQPGGIAARDGRLREGDQILAIDGQPLDISHQEAIRILQSAQGLVELVVAHGPPQPEEPVPPQEESPLAPATATPAAVAPQEQSAPVEGPPPPSQPPPLEEAPPEDGVPSSPSAEKSSDMVLSTEWTQLEVIDLVNDGTGLGFGIIGGRSTGVVVKTILPGGVADLDGRLRSGDHILQIGDVNCRSMSSEQVALVLRQSGSHVRLIVARSLLEPPAYPQPHAPVIPTHLLDDHLQHINLMLAMEGQGDASFRFTEEQMEAVQHQLQQQQLHGSNILSQVQVHPQPYDSSYETADSDVFDVDLVKDAGGLGITIAGYVGGESSTDDISGIFVKSIADNSAAAVDGRINVNDQIIEVDGQPLHGYNNHQAVEVLRNTGQLVHLKLRRYHQGPKYENLQRYIAQAHQNTAIQAPAYGAEGFDMMANQVELDDVKLNTDEDYSGELLPDVEAAIKACWEPIIGPDFEVVVSQLSKFKEGGGLGISLEGTVDVENGVEVRPHHYIRSILPEGPVGLNGALKSGDELLEVNGRRLLGLNHVEVVSILKELPQHVRLVCARKKAVPPEHNYAPPVEAQFSSLPYPHSHGGTSITERLVKAKSEMALASSEHEAIQSSVNRAKSRSLELLNTLAIWSTEAVMIELYKGESGGLGFSILDYQDPVNPNDTVIVIRSLVPGGVAQQDGRLVPGDRLIFVNDINLEHATLNEAVEALKGAPKGIVRIGVAKPLPLTDVAPDEAQPRMFSAPPVSIADTPAQAVTSAVAAATITSSQASTYSAAENFAEELPETSTVVLQTETTVPVPPPKSSPSAQGAANVDRKDSFYEEDVIVTPRRHSPRKTPVKEDNPPPYENVVLMQKQQSPLENAKPVLPPKPALREKPELPRREVEVEQVLLVKEAAAMLPTYEEAVGSEVTSGVEMEVFSMQEEAPPVPPRNESTSLGPLEVATEYRLPSDTEQEEPPPLPASSPPPIPQPSTSAAGPLDEVKLSPRIAGGHRKSGSVSSSVSSSSDVHTASDLRGVSSPPSTPRTMSPGMSPLGSPSTMRNWNADALPVTLEKIIKIQKGNEQLGLSVEAVDKGINGCMVKAITKGAVSKDGRLQVGDYVTSVNNESMRRITNAQARAILRRATLLSTDISINYITAADAASHRGSVASPTPEHSPQHRAAMASPSVLTAVSDSGSLPSPPVSPAHGSGGQVEAVRSPPLGASAPTPNAQGAASAPRQKSLASDGSPAGSNQAWGPPRTVQLERMVGKSLGISIVGGRVDMFHISQEHTISGIFIKHVLEDSPAGRNGTLKTGDRILEVNGNDLRSATHDEAVLIIRNATTPVTFVVQSLSDSACPGDIEGPAPVVQWVEDKALVKPSSSAKEPPLDPKDSVPTAEDPSKDAGSSEKVQMTPIPEVQESGQEKEESVAEVKQDVSLEEKKEKEGSVHKECPAPSVPSKLVSVDNAEPKPEAIPESDGEDEDEYGYNPKKLQKKYGDLGGEVHLVELQRGGNGLGLSLAGNKDRNTMSVFVAGVQPDSTAAKDGRIRIGDELLEVNGQVLYGRSHLNASAIIKGINTPVVKIVLLRRDNYLDLMAVKPLKLGPAASPDEAPVDVTGSPPSGHAPPPLPSSVPPARPEENAVPPPVTLDVVQTVVLQKGPQGLGFGIQEDTRDGRHGIYVRSITPGGIAAQDGQLAVGDQILEVGDRSLAGIQYDKAIDILRQTQGTVKLKIRKSGSVPQPAPGTTMILGSTVGESSTDTADTSDPKTCRIVAGKETLIEIEKGRTGLGLSIVGGADTLLGAIIIHEVYDDGAAARDGRLMAGDQILDVNGEDMRDATHERAIQVLRLTPSNVRMLVYRDDNEAREEDLYDIFTVELMKRPGKGLGLSIVGKKKDVGVYISDIVKGGVAEADGRLMQGDQILSVNGEDMRKASQEYAAGVLKTLMGKVTLQVGRLKAGSRASSRRNSNSPGSALKKSDSSSSSGRSRGKHSKSGSEDASHIRNVQVTQDAQGSLGISIAGGKGSILGDVPVIIASLSPNGPAMQSGKLREGDKILMVNGTLTDGLTCDEVITLLKSQPTVMLQVMQGEEMAVNVNSTGSMPRSRQVSADRSMEAVAQEMASDLEESHTSECRTVILNRGPEGLGFSIVGGHGSPHGDLPIYVKNVFSKGAAADSGQLKRGDQILAVNGQSLEGVTHDEAVNILKNIRGTVTLTIMS